VVHFQPQPAGLGLFFRPTVLDEKIASSSGGDERSTSPSTKQQTANIFGQ